MRPITDVTDELGMDRKYVIPYGQYKAKVHLDAIPLNNRKGKLIVVTGITPTPAGEGKTTTVVGLTQSLGQLGKNVVATLREPSLGPIFGIKGGGTGGGKSMIQPEDEVNIHFTGDAHAVGSAHNLLAAIADNAAQRGQVEDFRPEGITWRRVMDVEDRAIRSIITGLGGTNNAPVRETGFDIVTASEIMAILSLAGTLENLRERLSRIVIGYSNAGKPVTASDVNAVGSMMSLLRNAIQPNVVQTTEGQPVVVHTGPFGNIAHGCSSVVGDRLALGYADYVLTEAGFGADLGFEKFMHIKARFNGLEPHAAVLVASVRGVKYHGGVRIRDLDVPNLDAVRKGAENLEHSIRVIKSFNVPVVVALNYFPTDTDAETAVLKKVAEESGAFAAVSSKVFIEGGSGGIELAQALLEAIDDETPQINYAYPVEASILDKVNALAKLVYNADGVEWGLPARRRRHQFEENGWGEMPVCMAKTHLSISHRATLKGRPSRYTFQVSDVRASVGAGFIYPIAGNIMTMPGLPGSPRHLDVDDHGNIIGL